MKRSVLLSLTFFVSIVNLVHAEEFKLPTDIQFTGTVVNSAPKWAWRVHSAAQGWASNWDSRDSEGITQRNGEVVFSYTDRNSKGKTAFIQGLTLTPVAQGGVGLTPVVSINDANGRSVVLNGNTTPQEIEIAATGRLYGGKTVPGIMSVTVESATAVAYKKKGISSEYYTESYNGAIGWAANSIIIENYGEFYKNSGIGNHIRRNSGYDILSVLRGNTEPDAYSIMAAFTSHLSKIKTHWKVVPYTWTATITAQVKIQ